MKKTTCYVMFVDKTRAELRKAKEDAHYIYLGGLFRRGSFILKTVPPKVMSRRGRTYNIYWVWAGDIHTFDPQTGEILDEKVRDAIIQRMIEDQHLILENLLKTDEKAFLREIMILEKQAEKKKLTSAEILELVKEGKLSLMNLATEMIQVMVKDLTPHQFTDKAIAIQTRASFWEGWLGRAYKHISFFQITFGLLLGIVITLLGVIANGGTLVTGG